MANIWCRWQRDVPCERQGAAQWRARTTAASRTLPGLLSRRAARRRTPILVTICPRRSASSRRASVPRRPAPDVIHCPPGYHYIDGACRRLSRVSPPVVHPPARHCPRGTVGEWPNCRRSRSAHADVPARDRAAWPRLRNHPPRMPARHDRALAKLPQVAGGPPLPAWNGVEKQPLRADRAARVPAEHHRSLAALPAHAGGVPEGSGVASRSVRDDPPRVPAEHNRPLAALPAHTDHPAPLPEGHGRHLAELPAYPSHHPADAAADPRLADAPSAAAHPTHHGRAGAHVALTRWGRAGQPCAASIPRRQEAHRPVRLFVHVVTLPFARTKKSGPGRAGVGCTGPQ